MKCISITGFHFKKNKLDFPNRIAIIITEIKGQIYIILCCPCYMPKFVPRLEGIMHFESCIMPSNIGTYFGI